jgi:FO synthase subunit 2
LTDKTLRYQASLKQFHYDCVDQAVAAAADVLREETVGARVTYVINRNINFTNVCVKRCGFCAFSRTGIDEEGYFLPQSEVVRRAREAWDLGASEVSMDQSLNQSEGFSFSSADQKNRLRH